MELTLNNRKINIVDNTDWPAYPGIGILVDGTPYVIFEFDEDKQEFFLRGYSDDDESEEPTVSQKIVIDKKE